jgi:hypothetical protein
MIRYRHWFLVIAASATLLATRSAPAGPVSLPFFEPFNTPTADAVATYPLFTADDGGSGLTPVRYVNAGGVLRFGSGGFPFYPNFGVTPTPAPTGEIVINLDMGWNGQDNDPPVGVGFGGTGLRLGNNLFGFHPGYPSGALRIEGSGGFGSTDMGFTPGIAVLNHAEIHSFPSGLFTIKITDGTNPANVFTTSFTNAASYGGAVSLLAFAGGSAMYDNLSIAAVPEPTAAALLGVAFATFGVRRARAARKC